MKFVPKNFPFVKIKVRSQNKNITRIRPHGYRGHRRPQQGPVRQTVEGQLCPPDKISQLRALERAARAVLFLTIEQTAQAQAGLWYRNDAGDRCTREDAEFVRANLTT